MTRQSVGSDASRLSCFLFRPRKSREKRRKRSHINASNASVTRTSTPPAQTVHVCLHSRKRVHTCLRQQDRTQRLTGRNRGVSDGGWYHYPRSVLRGSETLRGRVSERQTLPLLGLGRVLPKNAESLRDSDALMRVAVPRRRGPAGLRDLFTFVEIVAYTPCAQGFLYA